MTRNNTSKYGKWETLLDEYGTEVNINDGCIAKRDDSKFVSDCRLYLFVQRYGGGVKPGADLKRSTTVGDTVKKGEVYLRS